MKNLRILRDDQNQVLFADFRHAVELSKGRIISNCLAQEELIREREHVNFDSPMWAPFWTKTILAYPRSGQPFGVMLDTTDDKGIRYRLETGDFAGLRNAALVLENYEMRFDGLIVHYEPRAVRLVENFPQKSAVSDRFELDGETCIPVAKKGGVSLWRSENASIVPVVRATYGSAQPAIWVRHGIGSEFSVIVED